MNEFSDASFPGGRTEPHGEVSLLHRKPFMSNIFTAALSMIRCGRFDLPPPRAGAGGAVKCRVFSRLPLVRNARANSTTRGTGD